MTEHENPRAHLDQYAAVLRDLRHGVGGIRPDHVALPPGMDAGQADKVAELVGQLAHTDGFDQTAATIAGTLAKHLPFVPVEHIGAVLLDLSQFMIGFVAHPDAEAAAIASTDLPLLVALVGQEMYAAAGAS